MGNNLKIADVGDGLFRFRFKIRSQMEWVFDKGPWSFDNHLLVVRRREKGMTAQNITFPVVSLWVQVWGVPFELFNEEAVRDIGGGIGIVIVVDDKPFSLEQARFLRIRVEIPLTQPLRQDGPVVNLEGECSWVLFKYERIVGLCFSCGRFGHEKKACPYQSPSIVGEDSPNGE